MNRQDMQATRQLLSFINASPTAFHAVESAAKELEDAGFLRLQEGEPWALSPGKGYFLTRNQSSIIAFRIPREAPVGFMISASHTDSPTFKLKNDYTSVAFSQYVRFNTEPYGGTIFSSWFDRPLSIAGRVVLVKGDAVQSKTVKIDRDLVLIPNVAIHFNRTINNGYSYNPAVDLQPLFSIKGEGSTSLKSIIAKELSVSEEMIAGMDLYLYNRTLGTVWGADNEFFSAPRIDNLMCMYGTLKGFLQAEQHHSINVFYAADNEETGSSTKQGAASVFLSDVLDRICNDLALDKCQLLASSMMVSADNGHAKHPNHPELSDAQNAPKMGGGVVIKSNASQKYTTDGVSSALFTKICKDAGVATQFFSNRSDLPGGSTLGSISNTQVPLITVDIGMAQLAMHSSYETAGSADTQALIDAMTAFYQSSIKAVGDGNYTIQKA